jgi:hypothetical protein
MPLRLRLPFVQIRIAIKFGSRPMELPPPRFTVRGLMIAVAVVGTFLAWVHVLEMRRVVHYREIASRSAEAAVKYPKFASEFTRSSRDASLLARPWASGWSSTLGFGLISFCVIGLLLCLAYRMVRFVLSPYLGQTGSPEPR